MEREMKEVQDKIKLMQNGNNNLMNVISISPCFIAVQC